MLRLPARARLRFNHADRLRLAHTLARIGFHRLRGRERSWLAFRHGKDEYGIDSAGAEGPGMLLPMMSPQQSPPPGNLRRMGEWVSMEEREFFNETTELRTHTITCPKCGQAGEYKVSWVVRRKRAQLPRNADERDRARFAKAQSYMVRRDDKLSCTNVRCRKPFEITSLQSLAFLTE